MWRVYRIERRGEGCMEGNGRRGEGVGGEGRCKEKASAGPD